MLGNISGVCSGDRGFYDLVTNQGGCSTNSFSSHCLQGAHMQKREFARALAVPILAFGKKGFTVGGTGLI